MNCKTCGKKLGPKNASGFCRNDFNRQPVSAETRAKRAETLRATLMADPVARERRRQAIAEAARRPEIRALRSKMAKEQKLWVHSIGKMTREQLDRRNRSLSATRLSHIPSEYRDQYRTLKKRHGLKADEAYELISQQIEADKKRWRREWAA